MNEDIEIGAIYGAATKRGLVDVTWGDQNRKISPDSATKIGLWLIEAAEAARGEEVLVNTLLSTGMPLKALVILLNLLRKSRIAGAIAPDDSTLAARQEATG